MSIVPARKAPTPPRASAAAPSIEIVDVTPEWAQLWIDGSDVKNRKVSSTVVARYAAEMLAGRWSATSSVICLTPAGGLIDGQHRLHAVIKAGVPVRMTVRHDAQESDFATHGQGKNRSARDVIGMCGSGGSDHLVAMCVRFACGPDVIRWRGSGASNAEIARVYTENRDLFDTAVRDASAMSRRGGRLLKEGPLSVMLCTGRRAGIAVDDFAEMAAVGLGVQDASPALALRQMEIRWAQELGRHGHATSPRTRVGTYLKALQKHHEGVRYTRSHAMIVWTTKSARTGKPNPVPYGHVWEGI